MLAVDFRRSIHVSRLLESDFLFKQAGNEKEEQMKMNLVLWTVIPSVCPFPKTQPQRIQQIHVRLSDSREIESG